MPIIDVTIVLNGGCFKMFKGEINIVQIYVIHTSETSLNHETIKIKIKYNIYKGSCNWEEKPH